MQKIPDLTTSGQKFMAGGLIGGVLLLLWFLLPPLIVIMANLYIAAGLAIPIFAAIAFRERIWEEAKRMSWNATKKIISNDKLWYMWRGHEYLVQKNEALNNDIRAVATIRVSNEKKLIDAIKQLESEKRNAVKNESSPATILKVIRNKVALLQGQCDMLSPRIESLKEQEKGLIELYENRVADTEMLKQTLEAKADEYETMKSISQASDNASAWLKDDPKMKSYRESLKQIDQSIAQFTANVENFQRNVLPSISASASSGNEEEGRLLIEKYKQERLQLN